MKKLLVLALFALSTVMAFATDPAKFLPSESGIVLYADGLRLTKEYAKLDVSKTDPKAQKVIADFNQVLKKHCVSLDQVFSGAVFFGCKDGDADDGGVLFSTAIPEASMPGLVSDLLALSGEEFQSNVVRSGKYMIYTFREAGEKADEDALCFLYLANDVVLVFIAEEDDLQEVSNIVRKFGGSPLLEKLDRNQLFSLYCDVRKVEKDPEKVKQAGINDFFVNLNLTGANQMDIELATVFNCISKEALQQVNMQVNMMVPLMLGMIFGKDPEISNDLMKGLSVTAKGNTLNASLKISEELSKRIEVYCSNPENFAPANPNEAAAGSAPAVSAAK